MKLARRLFLAVVFLALMLEATGALVDPIGQLGYNFHSDLTNVIHTHVIVSIFELLVALVFILWLSRGQRIKRTVRFERGTLYLPILIFSGMMLFGLLVGQLQGGATLTEALWEIRGFGMLVLGYFLVGMFIHSDGEVNQLAWVLMVAPTLLAINNILRPVLFGLNVANNDLAYDHVDSLIIGCGILLCLAIITYGGTRRQTRFAFLALPVLILSILIMQRRAAFPVVGIGVVVLVIFLLRLRPRLFWKYIPPLALLLTLYLVAFWNNTGTLGQPARAISSQFSPDPRDYASNLYRALEKADIVANIQQAPITGLGFGSPFTFYIQLPDLSFWPFWHYETHNAVLWLWMKDGVVGFIVFWWLLGRGAYDGSQAVETQREEWALVAELRKRFARRRGRSDSDSVAHSHDAHQVMYRVTGVPREGTARTRQASKPTVGLNVPTWERSDDRRSKTVPRSATLAVLVVAVCAIPMQIVYSYVDLGLVSERDMLLFGLLLGLIAQGHALLGVPASDKKEPRLSQQPRQSVKVTPAVTTEVTELVRRLDPQEAGVHASSRALAKTRRSGHPTGKTTTNSPLSHTIATGGDSSAAGKPAAEEWNEPPLPWEVPDYRP